MTWKLEDEFQYADNLILKYNHYDIQASKTTSTGLVRLQYWRY